MAPTYRRLPLRRWQGYVLGVLQKHVERMRRLSLKERLEWTSAYVVALTSRLSWIES